MHGHPDAVFGQRPDGHTYLCHTFDLYGAGRKESSGTGLGSRQNQKNISLTTIIIDLIERLFFDKKNSFVILTNSMSVIRRCLQ